MKPDELAVSIAIGIGLVLLVKSGALERIRSALGAAVLELEAADPLPEISEHAREARAYELSRVVIAKARAP